MAAEIFASADGDTCVINWGASKSLRVNRISYRCAHACQAGPGAAIACSDCIDGDTH